jgi:hypothetical protein
MAFQGTFCQHLKFNYLRSRWHFEQVYFKMLLVSLFLGLFLAAARPRFLCLTRVKKQLARVKVRNAFFLLALPIASSQSMSRCSQQTEEVLFSASAPTCLPT